MLKLLKRGAKGVLDGALVPLCQYVAAKIPAATVLRELERRTARECADYVQARMPRALQFERKKDAWDHALGQAAADGIVAEFGVWNGVSINHLARRLRPRLVHGFDSFEGLREDWAGWSEPKGRFRRGGRPPRVEANVRLVKGWFHETLPAFLAEHPGPFSFVHVDCDTYEAAKAVLDEVGPRLAAGSIVVFDEYLGYRGWRLGEHRAWREFVEAGGVTYEYLAFSLQTVSVRVTGR